MDEKKEEEEKSSWKRGEEGEGEGRRTGWGKASGAGLIGKSSMQRIIFCQFLAAR